MRFGAAITLAATILGQAAAMPTENSRAVAAVEPAALEAQSCTPGVYICWTATQPCTPGAAPDTCGYPVSSGIDICDTSGVNQVAAFCGGPRCCVQGVGTAYCVC